jgi:hypothetical protein
MMPFYTFQTSEAIRKAILTYISLSQGASQQFVAFHTQNVVRRCDPEPPVPVFRKTQYLRT